MRNHALALLLLAGCSMNVHGSDLVLFMGDSNTFSVQWMDAPGGFVAQLNAATGSTRTDQGKVQGGGLLRRSGPLESLFIGRGIREQVAAGNGWRAVDVDNESITLLAAVNAGTQQVPASIFNWVGINDADVGTPLVTFRSQIDDAIAKQHSMGVPFSQIVFVSILTNGELWAPGPLWANGAIDATIDNYNAQISASCAAAGALYIDVRSPALLNEVVNNPAINPCGNLMDCGTSPHIHVQLAGKLFLAAQIMPHVTVIP